MQKQSVLILSGLILIFLISVECRGKRIDIFSQDGGDLVQLRARPASTSKDVMYNALPKNSELKWNSYRDVNGNFVIPYRITGLYDSQEKRIIAEAMSRLENNTCIRFKRLENERDYIEIQNQKNEGCYTSVGRTAGVNVVMLEANDAATCIETDIVMHELMHSIGLWHEHMRYDRDNYITVIYENIQPMYESQFEKVSPIESTTYDVPYDYTSVMHYAETAFAKRGKISMQTKNPQYQKVIGNQRDASPNDYRKICLMYECSKCMGVTFDPNNLSTRKNGQDPDTSGAGLPPVTQGPVESKNVRPLGCVDIFPNFCPSLVQRGLYRCDLFGTNSCCGSCYEKQVQASISAAKNIRPEKGVLQTIVDFFG